MAIELPALIQKVRVDTSEMSKAENAARKLGSSFDDLDVSAKKAEHGISGVRKENERSTPVTRRANSELGVMIGKFRDAGKHGAVLSTVISTMKIPALVYAVRLATGAVADLGAGLVGLVGAMAPAAGAVAALPAAYLAIGSSVGVLKVATSGSLEAAKAISKYGESSKQAQEALKGLGPEARAFTVELGLMQKQWEGVTKATQAATLPGLTQALKNLQPLVPVISKAMAQAGASLAGVAVEGSKMMASGPFSKDLASIGTANAKVVSTLGSALLQMVSALRHLMIAAAPLTQWLADSVLAGARWVNSVTEQGRATGRLAAFFERTRAVLSQLGRITRDFGAALVNMFSIGGKNLGQPLLDGLERIMARFREFTESTEGKSKMADFFAAALPPLQALGRLLGALGGMFGRFATSADLAPIIDQITTRIVPAFEALSNMVSDRMGPALLLAAEAFLKFNGILSFSPIIAVVEVFSRLVIAIADLAGHVPMLGTIIASLLALKTAVAGLSFAFNITGITSLVSALTGVGPASGAATKGIAGFIAGLKGAEATTFATRLGSMFTGLGRGGLFDDLRLRAMYAMDGVKAAFTNGFAAIRSSAIGARLGTVFTGLLHPINSLKSAMIALNATFLTNPIFLIIAAITALIAGLVYAYFHFTAFRKVVDSTFRFIRDFIVGALTGVADFLRATWDAIATVFSTAFAVIGAIVSTAWRAYTTIITTEINIIRTIVMAAWNGIAAVFTFVFNVIKTIVQTAWTAITTVIRTEISIVQNVISAGWNAVTGVIRAVMNVIASIFSAGWAAVRAVVSTAMNVVRSVISAGWNVVTAVFRTAWAGIKTAVQAGISAVITLVVTIPKKILSALGDLGHLLFDAGKRIIQGLIDGIMNMVGAVGRAISSVVQKVRDFLPFSPAKEGPLSGAGDPYYSGQTIVKRLASGLTVARSAVGTATSKMVQEIADYLPHSPARKGPLASPNDPASAGAKIGRALSEGLLTTRPEMSQTTNDYVDEIARVLQEGTKKIAATKYPVAVVPESINGPVWAEETLRRYIQETVGTAPPPRITVPVSVKASPAALLTPIDFKGIQPPVVSTPVKVSASPATLTTPVDFAKAAQPPMVSTAVNVTASPAALLQPIDFRGIQPPVVSTPVTVVPSPASLTNPLTWGLEAPIPSVAPVAGTTSGLPAWTRPAPVVRPVTRTVTGVPVGYYGTPLAQNVPHDVAARQAALQAQLTAALKSQSKAQEAATAAIAAVRGYDRMVSVAQNQLSALKAQQAAIIARGALTASSLATLKSLDARITTQTKVVATAQANYRSAVARAEASNAAYAKASQAARAANAAISRGTSTSSAATARNTAATASGIRSLAGGAGGGTSAATAAQAKAAAAAQALTTAISTAKTSIHDLAQNIYDIATQITDRLNQIFESARGQMLGFLSITAGTAPTGGWKTATDLIKSMTDRLTQAKEYNQGLAWLQASGLNADTLAELINAGAAGAGDQVKALVSSLLTAGGPNLDMIKQINALQQETKNVSSAFGEIARNVLGPKDDQVIELNKQMFAKQTELNNLIRSLPANVAKALGPTIASALGISAKATGTSPIKNAPLPSTGYSKTPTQPIIAAVAGYNRVWNGYTWTLVPNPAAAAAAAASTPSPTVAPQTITTGGGTTVSGWLTLNGVAYASVAELVAALAKLQTTTDVSITNNVLKDQTPADATASTLRTLSSLGML